MILFDNISVGYSKELIKTDRIILERGKVHVLIGKNGSGKTTLFSSMIGQQKLLKGKIQIDNQDTAVLSSKELAKYISFVPASFPRADYLRVMDFVALGRSPYTNHFGHLAKSDIEVIEETLSLLGIIELKEAFVSELSDGQRQLVSIAKALAQETPIILLDEPLAYLDFSNRRSLLCKLQDLAAESNKCIIFSSHDIDVSIADSFNYLLIDDKTKKVQLKSTPSRNEIIETCFPE